MIKLLVVEDESDTRKGLMKHIRWNELGVHVVEEAKDGIEGLEVALRMHPDIVVSDIRMPGMNGIEFTSNVRQRFPECKIIYLSGFSDKEYLKAAIRFNAVSYVEKPIDIEEMQEVIKKAVHLCMENKKIKETVNDMNMALSGSLPFIRQNIVKGLVDGHIDTGERERILQLAGVSFAPGDAYTVSIIVPSYEEDESNDAKQRCCDAILEFLSDAANGFTHLAVMNDFSRILAISAHKADSRKDFVAIYHLLSEYLKEHEINCPKLSWVVGSTLPELSNIGDSYHKAAGFLKKLFYYDFGNVFYSDNRTGSVYNIREELLTTYAKLLQELQKDKIVRFAERLYQDIRSKTETPVDEVKNLFYRMLRMLVEQGDKRGLNPSESRHQTEEYDWAMIAKIDTLKHLKHYFLKKATDILDRLEDIESNSRAVLDVMKYIRGNYSDKEISVNMLADRVHLSPTYLSSLFRKETGKTISEYITEVRIQNSADLLMEPQSKLDEVADRSGYNDANYFSKAFKKIKGMTPSQFRRTYKS